MSQISPKILPGYHSLNQDARINSEHINKSKYRNRERAACQRVNLAIAHKEYIILMKLNLKARNSEQKIMGKILYHGKDD